MAYKKKKIWKKFAKKKNFCEEFGKFFELLEIYLKG